jgi:arginyl-tRNA synthetase
MVARDLLPNRLSDYLYQLAEKFHAFFRDCRVEGDPNQNSRLLLCEATARILHQGLHILGLKTIERM